MTEPFTRDTTTDSNGPSWKTIRVLIAEDSVTIRYYLAELINALPGFQVVGLAADGEQAVQLTAELRPDVISMDVRMPVLDGIAATRHIMAMCPVPVVIVSGLVEHDIDLSFKAIDAGALAVVGKPPAKDHPRFQQQHRDLVRTLAAMSKVSVVRRVTQPLAPPPQPPPTRRLLAQPEVLAIGASAGGPRALTQLLSKFPANIGVPVVVAQHIPQEFVPGLARWLDQSTSLTVRVAEDGVVLRPGVVNLSPGTAHMQVKRESGLLVVRLREELGPYRYQPAVDVLFESVAEACGSQSIGLLLTGMGDDGAAGLLTMREAGGRTFAQDEASATVFGMPGAAIAQGAVEQVVSLADLPLALLRLVPRTG